VNPHLILVYVPHFFYFDAVPHVAYPMREAWYHALAAQRGIVLVDPVDRMLAEFRRTGEPMHGFLDTRPAEGHLNARGHRIIGELLAAAIHRQRALRTWAAPGGTPEQLWVRRRPAAPRPEPAGRARDLLLDWFLLFLNAVLLATRALHSGTTPERAAVSYFLRMVGLAVHVPHVHDHHDRFRRGTPSRAHD
jgi:hypothetical protein